MRVELINRGDGYAHEQITVANTAIGFTASTYRASGYNDSGRLRAFITISGGQIRYRYDGSNPTTTSGHLAGFGDKIEIDGTVNIANFKAIRTGTTSGTLDVTYERVYG